MMITASSRQLSLLPMLLLLAAMASFQLGASLATNLMNHSNPFVATALRQGFSALFLIIWVRLWRFDWRGVKLGPLVIYGLSLSLMNLTFYMAIARIPLGIAVAIEFIGPLFVGIISSRKPLDFLWILVATLGLALLLPITQFSSNLDVKGILFAILAAIGWALYIISGHHLGKNIAGLNAVAIGMAISAFITIPLGVWQSGEMTLSAIEFLGYGAVLGLLSSAIPYSIEMFALKKLQRRSFSLLMSLEPALAALVGAFLLSQVLGLPQKVAIGLIILASVGSSYYSEGKPVNDEIIVQ